VVDDRASESFTLKVAGPLVPVVTSEGDTEAALLEVRLTRRPATPRSPLVRRVTVIVVPDAAAVCVAAADSDEIAPSTVNAFGFPFPFPFPGRVVDVVVELGGVFTFVNVTMIAGAIVTGGPPSVYEPANATDPGWESATEKTASPREFVAMPRAGSILAALPFVARSSTTMLGTRAPVLPRRVTVTVVVADPLAGMDALSVVMLERVASTAATKRTVTRPSTRFAFPYATAATKCTSSAIASRTMKLARPWALVSASTPELLASACPCPSVRRTVTLDSGVPEELRTVTVSVVPLDVAASTVSALALTREAVVDGMATPVRALGSPMTMARSVVAPPSTVATTVASIRCDFWALIVEIATLESASSSTDVELAFTR